ncbi:hypothetical protein PCANC_03533 [Puccinia coronata f. sp. avenae]|uniref:DUF4219 domain-containing protein n=1 Tax=Puccinia coronata f. sp. avenae TaxID=200324 RepID=A0A2N5W028_9BASI|nr:hypothetical protein PCANC_03533 [Puccinia coronata f. sp. avenae]
MTDKIETTLKADYLPILDGTNYTNWSGRIKEIPAPVTEAPRSLTLILSDISKSNILPYGRQGPHAFVTSIVDSTPSHYNQALKSAELDGWIGAICTELDAMKRLGVWEVVDRLAGIKTLGFVHKVSRKRMGLISQKPLLQPGV